MKRTWKLWVAALCGAGVTQTVRAAEPAPEVQQVNGHIFRRPAAPQYGPVCPPYQQWSPYQPYQPYQPVPQPSPNVPNPNVPVQPQPQAPVAPNTSFQASQGGTSAAHTNAPNMFGDMFGTRSSVITGSRLGAGVLNGQHIILQSPASNIPVIIPGNVTTTQGQYSVRIPAVGFQVGGIPINSVTDFVPGVNQRFDASASSVAQINAALPLINANPAVQATAANLERAANPQATLQSFQINNFTTAGSANFDGTNLQYDSTLTSVISTPVTIIVPTPGSGGVVGILKMAEDNNPLPRDRLIFNYDYFDRVPMTVLGNHEVPVNRYQFGFEKTFLNGRMSFEARLPFASTLSSSSTMGSDTLATELGNLRLTLKGLLLRGEKFNFSAGLGIGLPTADDIRVSLDDGTPLVDVQNESVQLSPFVALLWTPNDRLFAQAWYGFCFDTGGNPVTVNPYAFTGVTNPDLGRLTTATMMNVDLQLGYWVYQSNQGLLRGLAPFVELHYSGDAGTGQVINPPGSDLRIGNVQRYDEFNLTAGITTMIGQNATFAVGAAAPLLYPPGRTFDYQVGVRFNYFFGRTARERSGANSVSTFGP